MAPDRSGCWRRYTMPRTIRRRKRPVRKAMLPLPRMENGPTDLVYEQPVRNLCVEEERGKETPVGKRALVAQQRMLEHLSIVRTEAALSHLILARDDLDRAIGVAVRCGLEDDELRGVRSFVNQAASWASSWLYKRARGHSQ